ncbi:hypothetical protein QYM36_004301 [Artemia franciscana]|uniref:Homeobox domain-containing protein n=1 Tax=Artemia franciscana TaxID=6661 RepID=A0AA88I2M4_ARTSF|nr:hypothetical protein QYM36_004301 [Artemia franciscana]
MFECSGSVWRIGAHNGASSNVGSSCSVSPPAHSGPASSPTGSTGAASPSSGNPVNPCCDAGRPLVTDPMTGQSVCSCQYDRLMANAYSSPAARLVASASMGVGMGLSGVGMYSAAYPSTEQNPYPSLGVDSAAFYSSLTNPYGLKDSNTAGDMAAAWTGTTSLQPSYYAYDPAFAAYGYGAGYDLAARRKNATRESTATLKAWLTEHKKNPYPTKGEKIMLAIITKMTLTQVSTWFANARRRLKKENKMTWEPKNRTDDDDDIHSDDEGKDGKEHIDVSSDNNQGESDCNDDGSDKGDSEEDIESVSCQIPSGPSGVASILGKDQSLDEHSKPKIWSLADTAACKTPPPSAPGPMYNNHWMNNGGSKLAGFKPYSRYPSLVGYSNGYQNGSYETASETPPQTPPNMRVNANSGMLQYNGLNQKYPIPTDLSAMKSNQISNPMKDQASDGIPSSPFQQMYKTLQQNHQSTMGAPALSGYLSSA